MLRQERQKAFVVGLGHVEERDQLAVAAASFHQAAPDDLSHVSAREIVRLEPLVDHGPEVFAGFEPAPGMFRLRGTRVSGSRGR